MAYTFHFKHYRLPLLSPLRTAHGLWAEREGIIIRLEDETGGGGFGEIAPIPWFGTETVAEAAAICAKFGGQVSADALDLLPERYGCVRFALSCALRPDLGPAAAHRDEAPAASRLPVAALLPAGRDAPRVLRDKLEAGFLAFKWKVGVGAMDDEMILLDDLLAGLPAHVRLRLDANGAWNRRQAARWLEHCAGRPVEFVEQPVAPREEDTLLGLARDYPVTLALDESVVRLGEARRWQSLGWPGVFVIKPALAGPLPELVEWIAATKADVVISSAIETALGRSAILQAVLSRQLTNRALGFGPGGIFGDRRWDGPFTGPLVDATCLARHSGEELWTALN